VSEQTDVVPARVHHVRWNHHYVAGARRKHLSGGAKSACAALDAADRPRFVEVLGKAMPLHFRAHDFRLGGIGKSPANVERVAHGGPSSASISRSSTVTATEKR